MTRRDSRSMGRAAPKKHWFQADEGEVHKTVFDYVSNVERQQFDTFNRFVQLDVLYDPNAPNSASPDGDYADPCAQVIENVIASNVDTVTAQIAATDVRARFQTDDGDWTTQRTATQLEWYAEGLGKTLDIHKACQAAFKSSAKKGTGLVKVYVDSFDEIKVEHVRVDDIVVDEAECRSGGKPRQMHQRMTNVDREVLKAQFPEYEEEIDRAQTGRHRMGMWAGYRPVVDDALVVIESWKLPIGRKGRKGYRPGRHSITIDSCDLLDEDWDKPFFPLACAVWSERDAGFYGISLAERIAGIQRALNKRNWQIDRNLDQYAIPTTYVDMADAKLAVQTINRIGTVVVTKGQRPTTVTPQANSPEVYQHRNDLKSAAFEDSGVSRMASQAVKPAGIDSGVGMREYRDQTTQRFAMQEKTFERMVLDVYLLVLDCCKDLGEAAPVIVRRAKFGARKIKWSDVDMGDVRVQIAAASTLPRTPAGRYQQALEWAQAGVITTDEWRRLTKHPDLDHILSLYTQGMESVERDIEAIEDGETVSPEPYGNLQLMVRMGQMQYLRDRDLNAPEEVLEGLRQYVVAAKFMLDKMNGAPANANAMPGQPTADPMAPLGAMPGGPGVGQPVAALAPEAMQLVAS
jgi:hypothetical protein